ncbi:MAG: STAS domain-containing protein [Selenomonas ruminantium]|nr:STAS domain-containing protein [Selenomonas ruminantium]
MNNVSVVGDTAIIRVPERYNLINTALIKGDLEDAYKAGAIKVTVDFRDAAYIDSSAIRDLVIIYNRVKAENFKVVNLSEDSDVFKALYAAKLDEKFGITKSS